MFSLFSGSSTPSPKSEEPLDPKRPVWVAGSPKAATGAAWPRPLAAQPNAGRPLHSAEKPGLLKAMQAPRADSPPRTPKTLLELAPDPVAPPPQEPPPEDARRGAAVRGAPLRPQPSQAVADAAPDFEEAPMKFQDEPTPDWMLRLEKMEALMDKVNFQIGIQGNSMRNLQTQAGDMGKELKATKEELQSSLFAAFSQEVESQINQMRGGLYEDLNTSLSTKLREELSTGLNAGLTRMRSELSEELGKRLRTELFQDLTNSLSAQLTASLEPKIRDELTTKLSDSLSKEICSILKEQLGLELRTEMHEQLRPDLHSRLDGELTKKLGDQLSSQLAKQLGEELRADLTVVLTKDVTLNVKTALHDELAEALSENLTTSLRTDIHRTSHDLHASTRSSLYAQLYPELKEKLWSELEADLTTRFRQLIPDDPAVILNGQAFMNPKKEAITEVILSFQAQVQKMRNNLEQQIEEVRMHGEAKHETLPSMDAVNENKGRLEECELQVDRVKKAVKILDKKILYEAVSCRVLALEKDKDKKQDGQLQSHKEVQDRLKGELSEMDDWMEYKALASEVLHPVKDSVKSKRSEEKRATFEASVPGGAESGGGTRARGLFSFR